MKIDLAGYKKEMQNELIEILSYWEKYAVDQQHQGFYGQVDDMNRPTVSAEKGLVLNSRILWTFSAAYNYTNEKKYLAIADLAFEYITQHFIDEKYGGAYWSVDYKGKLLNGRKQIYGIAFCIYGLSEYCKAKNDAKSLTLAKNLFKAIEEHSFDKEFLGYYEAFDRDWSSLQDVRLSEKDANEQKTMNTHLHIIEAYSNLYQVWQDDFLREKIQLLLEIFSKRIIAPDQSTMQLFFDERWNSKSEIISYGHDIEAAWLLQQCAEKINDEKWIGEMKGTSVKIVDAAIKGLDKDGGLWYEFDKAANKLIKEKHWWPQAEAMIGFMNAFQLTGHEKYATFSFNTWQFVKNYVKDLKNGEWFWGVNADHSVMKGQDKIGFWKCPYHNARACLEIISRINLITAN